MTLALLGNYMKLPQSLSVLKMQRQSLPRRGVHVHLGSKLRCSSQVISQYCNENVNKSIF